MNPESTKVIDLLLAEYHNKYPASKGKLKAVFYTDGSCDNNAPDMDRIGGAGVHGYLCDLAIPDGKNSRTFISGQVTTTSFGYVSTTKFNRNDGNGYKLSVYDVNNAKVTAVAEAVHQLLTLSIRQKERSTVNQATSSNRAELLALLEALRATKVLHERGDIQSAHFRLDSEYARKCAIEWRPKWKKNHWRNDAGPIKNVDLIIEIDKVLGDLVKCKLTFEWIKGHSDYAGNILADSIAAAARLMVAEHEENVEYNAVKEAELVKKADEVQEATPIPSISSMLLGAARQYYVTDQKKDARNDMHFYYLGRHGKDNDDAQFGHRMGDLMYGVVLTEPDECLERLMGDLTALDEAGDRYDLARIYITSLPYLALKDVRARLVKDGIAGLDRKAGGEVYIDEKRLLTSQKNPIGSAFIAMEALDGLKGILKEYLDGTLPDNYQVTDVSEHFYGEKDTKKGPVKIALPEQQSIKCKVKHRFKRLDPVAEHSIQLSIGIDTPNRRTFLALLEDEPVVEILTFPVAEVAFRYMLAIRTKSGRAGLYSGAYSNLRILTARELPK